MPDEEMFTVKEIMLKTPVEEIVSRPGVRVNCDICGEEIINEREVLHEGMVLCRACAGDGYYRLHQINLLQISLSKTLVTV